ncbi:MAG TPA: DUF3943 domain-containing protein [Puia sp.]|nr:DUF3943 domain-containing protein [Puia sp.]
MAFLVTAGCKDVAAQQPTRHYPPDTPATRHFGRAASTLGLGEAGPYLFDRYWLQRDYTRISFQTIGDNLKPSSWAWDNDPFQTNEIGHPYHGSILFNAFRSNGFQFWPSAAAAFAGSYLWESFAENQAPAPNDFINTGFGGMVLGEMTHRMSGKLVNNRSRGFMRQVNEVLAMLINPSEGLTRLTTGKWGRPAAPDEMDATPMSIDLEGGMRKYSPDHSNPFSDGSFRFYGRLHLLYGSPYNDLRSPFSNLHLTVEVGQDDSSRVNIVSVYGSLTGLRLHLFGLEQVAVLSANYDYINNEAFFYSAQSVQMNLYSGFRLAGPFSVNMQLAAGPVILAAVPDGYLFEGRNYDYGPGLAFHASASIFIGSRFHYYFTYRGGWMSTVNGNSDGYFLHAITNEAGFRLVDNLSLVVEYGYFGLHGAYRHYNTVDRTYPYLRSAIRWGFGFREPGARR